MIPGLVHTATVYTEDANGRFLTVATSGLRCRLAHVGRQPAATGLERAELGAMRRLLWGAEYEMPEAAQVEVGGVRWNVVAGTLAAFPGPMGAAIHHRSCDLVRAPNG